MMILQQKRAFRKVAEGPRQGTCSLSNERAGLLALSLPARCLLTVECACSAGAIAGSQTCLSSCVWRPPACLHRSKLAAPATLGSSWILATPAGLGGAVLSCRADLARSVLEHWTCLITLWSAVLSTEFWPACAISVLAPEGCWRCTDLATPSCLRCTVRGSPTHCLARIVPRRLPAPWYTGWPNQPASG